MAKLLIPAITLALVLLIANTLAYRTTITTVEVDDTVSTSMGRPSRHSQQCQQEIQRQDLNNCEEYVRQQVNQPQQGQQGQQQQRQQQQQQQQQRRQEQQCCQQLENLEDQCQCEALEQIFEQQKQQVQQQQRQGRQEQQRQGQQQQQQIQQVARMLQDLPIRCQTGSQRCQIQARSVLFI